MNSKQIVTDMSTAQTRYMMAKAAYETAVKASLVEYGEIEHLMDTDDDLYVEKATAIDIRYGVTKLQTVLRNAEVEMIDWAMNKVQKEVKLNAEAKAAMELVKSKLTNATIRRNVINMAFKLR